MTDRIKLEDLRPAEGATGKIKRVGKKSIQFIV